MRHAGRLAVRVDKKLDVRLTQAERGGGVGLCGAAVVQEAGDGVGGWCLAQGLFEDVDDFWRHSGDGDAAGGRVSGQGNVLGCQALESVEGGFLRQYFWIIDELIEGSTHSARQCPPEPLQDHAPYPATSDLR